jgi:hypothetical protein
MRVEPILNRRVVFEGDKQEKGDEDLRNQRAAGSRLSQIDDHVRRHF